jgi:hypothetical protein
MSGKLRTKSGEWNLHEKKTRDTLVPCPVCKETGLIVQPDGRSRVCRWCGGMGGVTKDVYVAFQRWLRIVAAAKRAGRLS